MAISLIVIRYQCLNEKRSQMTSLNISQDSEVSLARREPSGPIPAEGGLGLVVALLLGTVKARTQVRN